MSEQADQDLTVVVLVHSPLVGPFTWLAVSDELRRRGLPTVVPDLATVRNEGLSFCGRHAASVVEGLRALRRDRKLVLVGHSGAGALLPSIALAAPHPVAGYIFVDAGIPTDGQSQLGQRPFSAALRELYASGGRYPNWTDDDLREDVPNDATRARLLADVRPPPLAFWEEPIPVFAGWPDAPCGYLRFVPNPSYDTSAATAQRLGWPYVEIPGGHFHLLVNPSAVATALIQLTRRLGVSDLIEKVDTLSSRAPSEGSPVTSNHLCFSRRSFAWGSG